MLASHVAEGAHEALTSPIARMLPFKQDQGQSFSSMMSNKYLSQDGSSLTIEQLMTEFNEYKARVKAEMDHKSLFKQLGGLALSTVGLFLTALTGGISQFLGASYSMGLSTFSIYCRTEDISLKNIYSGLFKQETPTVSDPSFFIDQEVSDAKRFNWGKALKFAIYGSMIAGGIVMIGGAITQFIASLTSTQVPVPSSRIIETIQIQSESTVMIIENAYSYSTASISSFQIKPFSTPISSLATSGFIAALVSLTFMTRKANWKDSGRMIDKYTTENLIEDLILEIQTYPEELALLFPQLLERFQYTHLSRFWGFSSAYVSTALYNYQKNPSTFELPDESIKKLESIIDEKLGVKGTHSKKIISDYRNKKVTLPVFLDRIRSEIGRISGEIELIYGEINSIFGFLVDDVLQRIQNPRNSFANPDYKFSIEVLDNLISNLKVMFNEKASKCQEIIKKYKEINKPLKEYSLQQHNVRNPHYFKNLRSGETTKAYLFGFMCADAYIVSKGSSKGQIGIAVKRGDEVILQKFKNELSVDNTIKHRTIFHRYKGEIKEYFQSRLRFICQPMWRDLLNLEFSSSKTLRKKVPSVIQDLVLRAKEIATKSGKKIDWRRTKEGQTALAWLLGFYDGDGSLALGKYGCLYSASKEFLESVKDVFGITKHHVKVKVEGGEEVFVFDNKIISKGYYYLMLDKWLFTAIMQSYHNSLKRKRPV